MKSSYFLCLRKCDQDQVENMHRAFRGFNDNPMLHQYVTAIKCLSCSLGTKELIDSSISTSTNCAVESCLSNEEEILKTAREDGGHLFDFLKFSDTVCTENSFFSTTSKNNTHLPQVNNNSGNTAPTNNSVV